MRGTVRALLIGATIGVVGAGLTSADAVAASPTWQAKVVAPPADGKSARNSLVAVKCTVDQVCVGVGAYFAGKVRAADLVTMTDGHVTSVVRAPLPGDAKPSGTSYLADVSCWAPGACVAVGWYTPRSGVGLLVETLADGTWTPLRAPVPAGTAIPKLAAVDCNSTSCVATGVDSVFNTQPVLLVRSAAGTWTAPAVSLPAGTQHVDLSLPTCPPSGACVISGHDYLAGLDQAELFGYPSGDGWNAIYYPHPDNANPATLAIGGMSCPATSTCVGLGSYFDIALRRYRAVSETLSNGVLKAAILPVPQGWKTTSDETGGADISCSALNACVGYVDTADPSLGAALYRLDGKNWSVSEGPTGFDLQDADCSTAGSCAAVGALAGEPAETTYRSGDGSWLPQSFDPTALDSAADGGSLASISCAGNECVAGGALTSSGNWKYSRAIDAVGRDLTAA